MSRQATVTILVLLIAGLLSSGACAGRRGADEVAPAEESDYPPVIAQVLYRGEGTSRQAIVLEHLADQGIVTLTGAATPFEAWAAVVDPSAGVRIVYAPATRPLAEAIARRIRLAVGESSLDLRLLPEEGPMDPTQAEIWVVAPRWEGGRLRPHWLAADAPVPPLVFADLRQARVEGELWAAETLIAASSPRAAALAAGHLLGAHARGAIGDPAQEASAVGLDLGSVIWENAVVLR